MTNFEEEKEKAWKEIEEERRKKQREAASKFYYRRRGKALFHFTAPHPRDRINWISDEIERFRNEKELLREAKRECEGIEEREKDLDIMIEQDKKYLESLKKVLE